MLEISKNLRFCLFKIDFIAGQKWIPTGYFSLRYAEDCAEVRRRCLSELSAFVCEFVCARLRETCGANYEFPQMNSLRVAKRFGQYWFQI